LAGIRHATAGLTRRLAVAAVLVAERREQRDVLRDRQQHTSVHGCFLMTYSICIYGDWPS
jgi:hypothetical protein